MDSLYASDEADEKGDDPRPPARKGVFAEFFDEVGRLSVHGARRLGSTPGVSLFVRPDGLIKSPSAAEGDQKEACHVCKGVWEVDARPPPSLPLVLRVQLCSVHSITSPSAPHYYNGMSSWR
jgi:hypothetical protein